MTNPEIKKGLECCQTEYRRNCKECPYRMYLPYRKGIKPCIERLLKDALDLTNRQEDIKQLENWVDALSTENGDLYSMSKTTV